MSVPEKNPSISRAYRNGYLAGRSAELHKRSTDFAIGIVVGVLLAFALMWVMS